MGNVIPFAKSGGKLPDFLIATDTDNSEFSHGAGEGFGVLSYRGKVWRLKYKGEEHVLTNADDEPVTKLRVVLLRANKEYSKIYYKKSYTEGDDAAPDCFSTNGITPDASIQEPPSAKCESCPMNIWGSRINENGNKTKACQDSRRMAVLLAHEGLNVTTDEPVLLRVPAASLGELKTYSDGMAKAGISLWKVITQVGFDVEAAYPRLKFTAFGWDEEQVENWRVLRQGETVKRILSSTDDMANVAPAPAKPAPNRVAAPVVQVQDTDEEDDEDEEQEVQPTPKAKKQVKKKPVTAEEVEEVEDDVAEVSGSEDINSIVNDLLGI